MVSVIPDHLLQASGRFISRNSTATKPQPLAAPLLIICSHKGKRVFSLYKKAGASDQSGIDAPVLFYRQETAVA
jgi:hypothetical protein